MSDVAPAVQYPQLRMEITGLAERPSTAGRSAPQAGYGLRTFRPGDEDAWLALLQSGEFGAWNRTRLKVMLASEHVRVPLDGIFFATLDDQPIGTASTYLHPRDVRETSAHQHPGAPSFDVELGWVVVDPRHRGRGLGLLVCQAVLAYIERLGHDQAYLLTDDFRLPAIRAYLKLGFEPVMTDSSHPERWTAIRRQLGE